MTLIPVFSWWDQLQKVVVTNICVPRVTVQLSPASPGGSPRSISGFHSGSFHITASTLDQKTCEILCVPFKKSGVSFPKVSTTGFQNQTLERGGVLLIIVIQGP